MRFGHAPDDCMLCRLSRRRMLFGCGAALLASVVPAPVRARTAKPVERDDGATFRAAMRKLPARSNLTIRSAYVLTMDSDLGDLENTDIQVVDGAVAAVGRRLPTKGTEIDGRGFIVMPGLVETHWHMWGTLLRSMAGDVKARGYFPTVSTIGKSYEPADMYLGAALSAAEAISSGITFVHDWCHNIQAPSFADADLQALIASGIRGRFSYGYPNGQAMSGTIDFADVERLKASWSKYSNDDLLSLGIAWRGLRWGAGIRPRDLAKSEFERAHKLGLPLSVHASVQSGEHSGEIGELADANLLDPTVQVIHAIAASDEEIAKMATARCVVSLSPLSELRIGFGFAPVAKFLDAKIPLGLSVDTTVLTGNADMFGIMKTVQNIANGAANDEFKLRPKRILELATIEGARSMGVDKQVGSLTPGKRADLIMVNTRAINIGPFTDPYYMLVDAAEPANVDTVIVDGRVLKRDGRLTAIDTAALMKTAQSRLAALLRRANWPPAG
jgi:cytosine/adenosine deaminase-related metal-dependent hydrolase